MILKKMIFYTKDEKKMDELIGKAMRNGWYMKGCYRRGCDGMLYQTMFRAVKK